MAKLNNMGMIRCKDCRFYKPEEVYWLNCDAPFWTDHCTTETDRVAIVNDEQNAYALVGPEFGCIHAQPKGERKGQKSE